MTHIQIPLSKNYLWALQPSSVAPTPSSWPSFHMGGCQGKEAVEAIIIFSAGFLAATNITAASEK